MFNKICYVGGACLLIAGGSGLLAPNPSPQHSTNYATISKGKMVLGTGGSSGGAGDTSSNTNTNTNGAVDPNGSPLPPGNGDLSSTAYSMIGDSTAGVQGTDGGKLGCAAAVSLMFKQATGQDILPGQAMVTSTNDLYNGLSNDSRFVQVPLDQVQAGDILVTSSGNVAGHTGIVGNNGEVISNSSSGFNGSAPGTIQQNYNLSSWQTNVVSRNPGQSGSFRYVGEK